MARPRRALLVGGAVLATVAILLLLTRIGAEEEPSDSVADDLGVEDAAKVPCPDRIPRAEELTGPDELPIGPLAVRLCGAPPGEASLTLPANAVAIKDLDALVEMVNTADPVPRGEICTKELGPAYTLQFTYADGSSVLVIGETYGCRHLHVGGTDRTGVGTELLSAVQDRLA